MNLDEKIAASRTDFDRQRLVATSGMPVPKTEKDTRYLCQVAEALPAIIRELASCRDSLWTHLWDVAVSEHPYLAEFGIPEDGSAPELVKNGIRFVPDHPHTVDEALASLVDFVRRKAQADLLAALHIAETPAERPNSLDEEHGQKS